MNEGGYITSEISHKEGGGGALGNRDEMGIHILGQGVLSLGALGRLVLCS